MENIAPMAKILAEANGIDWRVIQGSGDGGSVVEQDILNYLMRVMNGDEEPPSTPVDEPPPDWTGEMPPMPSMEMMTQAGIESDITDFVASTAKTTPPAQNVPGTNSLTSDLDQDAMDFELDDDLGVPAEPLTPEPVQMEAVAPAATYPTTELAPEPLSAEAPMDIPEGAPDIDVELAEPMHAEPAHTEPLPIAAQADVAPVAATASETVYAPAPVQVEPPAVQMPAAQAAGAAAGGFALGSILSRLYKRKDGAHEEPAAPAPTPAPVQPPVQAAPEVVHEAPAYEAAPVHELPVHENVVHEEPVEQPVVETAALGEPVEPVAPVADSPVSAPLVAAQLREEAPAETLAEPEPELSAPVDEPVSTPAAVPSAAIPITPAPSAPVAAHSMADRRGVHLRLSVRTDALEAAGHQLGEHLGHAVPVEVLVARAAARSLDTLGLRTVAVAQLGDDVTPRASDALHGADFRAAVGEYHAGGPGDWADLMVVDAGQLGLDELHLTQDLATLSLGRRDGGTAALTLTGGVSPQAGAAFLQQVEALLQTPVKLLF